jgi:hypothetical protein
MSTRLRGLCQVCMLTVPLSVRRGHITSHTNSQGETCTGRGMPPVHGTTRGPDLRYVASGRKAVTTSDDSGQQQQPAST